MVKHLSGEPPRIPLQNFFKLAGSDQTDQSALGFDLVDLEDLIEGQVLIYLDREDKDEKTVERSPELSVGNGGELDLLEMEKSNFQIYVILKPIRLQRESLTCVKLLHTL